MGAVWNAREKSKADLGSRQLNQGDVAARSLHITVHIDLSDQLRAAAMSRQRYLWKDLPFRTDILYITY